MKNKNMRQSIRCALEGLKTIFIIEKKLRGYMVIALIMLMLNLILKAGMNELIIWGILSAIVMAAEMLNTVIEGILDMIEEKYNANVKWMKDVAAGVVLWFGILFFIVEGIILRNLLVG